MKRSLFITGLILLFAVEISRVYFIMPFPGSQKKETISFAYWLSNNITWIRILLLLLLLFPFINYFKKGTTRVKLLLSFIAILFGIIFYFFNFRFQADKMFYQPTNKTFSNLSSNTVDSNRLVIGITINNESKAYPIQVIGYHHQVRDTIGHTPVIVTYCTVCRTGRAFSPIVNGKNESFRLVGMDHFNAMFEDATTKSWWQQATGVAIAGPLKGSSLKEIPSRQSTLKVWLREHPASLILQPDTTFNKKYKSLADYDKGTIKGDLEKRDSASWSFKSWVIGINYKGISKAYDWNTLQSKTIIQDSLPELPLLIILEKDAASFHVYDRKVKENILFFEKINNEDLFKDRNTGSTWNMDGLCIDGALKNEELKPVQAYQEFWHSWRTFHPRTTRYQ